MIPIRDWEVAVGKWCPPIVLLVVLLLLLPLRVAALLLIPADARFTWHPLHKIHNFLLFRKH